jgi:hypothetical protein
VALLETDVVPCRAGWLDRLYDDATIGAPFWVKGTPCAVPAGCSPALTAALDRPGSMLRNGDPEAAQAIFADHFNGNALYALRDPGLQAYLAQYVWRRPFSPHRKHARPYRTDLPARVEAAWRARPEVYLSSYDVALYLVRRDRALLPLAAYQATQHLWVASATLQNWYRTPANATAVCDAAPDTFLVHGRHVYR